MIGTVHGIGMMFPVFISGWMADRFGRKVTLITCLVGYVVGYFKLLVTSYSMYLVVEFLEAAFSGGVLGCGTVLLIENIPKKYRMLVGVLLEIAFNLGECLFACLGMVAKNWRTLVLITYSPCILFLSYIFLLKESPRWQVLHGKTAEAKKTLRLMAKMNKVDINIKELENMDYAKLKELFNLEIEVKEEGFKEIFSSLEMMKRLTMGLVTKFTVSFMYYSLQINSVYLPGNKYINFLYGALMSCPGEFLALYLMDKYGRKWPLICGFVISAMSSVAMECTSDNNLWLKIVMFLITKVAISSVFSGIEIYVLEVYPTSVRGSMVGIDNLAANVGSMMAPLVPSFKAMSPVLVPVCYGGSSLLSAFILFFTPETNNLALPDTIEQIKNKIKVTKNSKCMHEMHDCKSGQVNVCYEHEAVSHL